MIERALKIKLLELAKKYPIVTVTGPRQSGKSTLLKNSFPYYKYVSLEDPDMRLFAIDDISFANPIIRRKLSSSKLSKTAMNKQFSFVFALFL